MNPARPRIALPYLATRVGLLLVGLMAAQRLIPGLALQKGNLVYHRPGPACLEIWARWDSEWYLLIAEQGYRSGSFFLSLPVAYQETDTTGFFPLYPLLIHALSTLGLPALLAGVLLSNLALLAALWFLWSLVERDHGEEVAERTLWVLLAFPTGFFLSAVYAESLMLACLLGSLWAVRGGRPWLCGIFAALCVLARPTGLLVLVPLADELILRRFIGPPREAREGSLAGTLAALGLPLAALAGYMVYCDALFGSATAFLLRQERWRGPSSGPWRAFARFLQSPQVEDAHHSRLDLAIALLLVGSIPFLFRVLRRSDALYATAAILLPLTSTLWSFSRFAATIYPFHILLALALSRRRSLSAAYFAVALPLQGFLMALFAAWWWAG
jgi:Mannosyltransferase (PIG-V)